MTPELLERLEDRAVPMGEVFLFFGWRIVLLLLLIIIIIFYCCGSIDLCELSSGCRTGSQSA
jgi:hypothetical protein